MSFLLPTFGGIPRPQEVTQTTSGTLVPSSFGISDTTFSQFSAHSFIASERYQMLEYKERYYRCTQHDWKKFDFNGQLRTPGPPISQPLLASAQMPHYVSLSQRRPSTPYHIARLIVNSFTSLLFGYGHFPQFEDGDPVTQDFADALAQETKLESIMIRGRNIGGSVGTAGFSWQFIDGKPRILTHNGKHLFVHEWADRDDIIPAHVSEIYQFPRDIFDPDKKKVIRKLFWFRRDWTLIADVVFKEVEVKKEEPEWEIDEEASFIHNDGFCHFVWTQNLPEDDATSMDGSVDYAELYECCDSIDTLNSVTVRGGINNLDPTLKLKMDPQVVNRFGIRKGSENAITVGLAGDASYMELSGNSIDAGVKLFANQRAAILEIAQCIVPDPNTITAAGTSSAALKIVFGPMLAKCAVLRTQYGTAIERILSQMILSAQKIYGVSDETEFDLVPDEQGNLQEVSRPIQYFLKLPPRIVEEPEMDESGNATGKIITKKIERHPGTGGAIRVRWSEYFASTTNDDQIKVQTLSVAAAGKQVLSRKSAIRCAAQVYRLDPDKEYENVLSEDRMQRERELSMFSDIGGEVNPNNVPGEVPVIDTNEQNITTPEDNLQQSTKTEISSRFTEQGRVHNIKKTIMSDPKAPAPTEETESNETPKSIKLGDKELAAIITVNEARTMHGLGPLMTVTGELDPDGDLILSEFKTKRDAKSQITGDAVGKEEVGEPLTAPEPPIPAPDMKF
jgi:hypothetical protein